MGLSSTIASYGIVALLVCCVVLLLSIFLIAPLPYIISAAVLKIEKRGYWKAFGTAFLGGLASWIISAAIVFIFSAVSGGPGNISLSDPNSIYPLLTAMMSRMWLVGLISTVVSILVNIAITAGLYRVKLGKGALIWLLAVVFAILINIVLGVLLFLLSLIGVLPSLKNLLENMPNIQNLQDIQNLIPGFTF